ncbi:hypothetical protein EON65_16890 [archaeon]|nr:MAG: hypothetical protein EON65_16890 [archaeon]
MDNLAGEFNKFAVNTTELLNQTTKTVSILQTSCDETQFQLKEMKDYVDHFADNLVLNSQQIMVDSYAGFANRPLNLTEIMRMCRSSLDEINNTDKVQSEKIAKAFAELDTKAPDSVLFNIATLEKKVGTIELHIQKEEEQGMGALRKTCEELSIHMQSVQVELADKIDRESVGFIVHEKYEEIVRYLQDALQSSLEDETNFKAKADEIQEMVILLSNSKADRTEIANMQEIMVKSEALLKKVGAQVNLKDKIKEFVPRKELEALLVNKVDKVEFESQLASALQNSRRNRYNAALATGLQGVTDEAMSAAYTSNPAADHAGPSMRPNSGSKRNKQGTSLPSVGQHGLHSQSAKVKVHNTSQLPLVDQGRLVAPHSDSENEALPVMAIGQAFHHGASGVGGGHGGGNQHAGGGFGGNGGGGGVGVGGSPTTIPNRTGSPNASSKNQDFSSFVKGRTHVKSSGSGKGTAGPGGVVGGGGKVSPLMSASTPNLAGVTGGFPPGAHQPALPEGYGASEYPYSENPQYRMNYPEQSQMTDHLAYLHGPMVGGGFNAKSAHILRALPAANPVAPDDVEGKGL